VGTHDSSGVSSGWRIGLFCPLRAQEAIGVGHSGAMRGIEPGIQGFPNAQLRI
jgi:hypothetical protein